MAPLPGGPVRKSTYIAGESLAVFKQSKNPDAAWRFIKWITKPETQDLFSKKSGYLPVRNSVLDLEDYKEFLRKDVAMKSFVGSDKNCKAKTCN